MIDKKKYYREYYKKNKKKYLTYIKKYSSSKKGRKKIKDYRDRKNVKIKINKVRREKVRNDKSFRLKRILYATFRRILVRYHKTGLYGLKRETVERYNKLYGINFKEIIEKSLLPLPKNLNDYDVDHIIPLCNFDFSKKKDIKKAYSYNNIRLMLRKDNKIKGKILRKHPDSNYY